jgi:superfamily II DNA or RNA helicase
MAKIVILGNNCKILEEQDISFLLQLDKHLSFYVIGAEHTQAFKGYVGSDGKFTRWDGFKKLLNHNLTFAAGLLERVKRFYAAAGKEVEIVDKRPPKSVGEPKDVSDRLAKMGITPYDYQQRIVDNIDGYEKGIIKLATGGGKSLIAALITARIGKGTIIYVVGKDLLYQFYKLFSDVFEEEIGLIGDGHCRIKNINIASVWTVGQALGMKKTDILLDDSDSEKLLGSDKYSEILKLMKATKVHIIDECHMAACDTIQKIYKCSVPEHIYGLSGSPWRDDGADMLIESVLGGYIMNIPATQLIKTGHLAQPIIKFVPVPKMKCERNYKQAYRNYIVENPERNNLVLKYAQTLTQKGYRTLILFNSIKHGKILYDLISPHIKCALLDGSDDQKTRNKVKKDLENGKINCILASRIFDIGIDIPSLSGLIVASAGKSTVKALQRVGRVIRRYPGKEHAAIVDFADNTVFLKNHAEIRRKIYASEEGFEVQWPKEERK